MERAEQEGRSRTGAQRLLKLRKLANLENLILENLLRALTQGHE